MAGLGLISRRRAIASSPTAGSDYIKFADEAVFNVLMSNGVSSDGVGITKDDAAKVTSFATWFKGNTKITTFEESRFFTSVTSIQQDGFQGCTSLKTFDFANILQLNSSAFSGCSSLDASDIPFHQFTLISEEAFANCGFTIADLKTSSMTTMVKNAFRGNNIVKWSDMGVITAVVRGGDGYYNYGNYSALTFLRYPSTTTSISHYAVYKYTNLSAIVIEATTPPSIPDSTTFAGDSGCPIYVPDASVDAYKTANNWTYFSARIKPISEYTE